MYKHIQHPQTHEIGPQYRVLSFHFIIVLFQPTTSPKEKLKERGEKFTKKRTTPDKPTSDTFLCILCSESSTQPLGIKNSLITSKQLSQETRICSIAQAELQATTSVFSLLLVVGTACTTEEEVKERECQSKKELLELIPVCSNKLDVQKVLTTSI